MARGNDTQRWEKILEALDEKLQLGLLDHLRKVDAFHFENDVLYLEPSSPTELDFWSRESAVSQLTALAQDAVGISSVKINLKK